MWLNKSVFAHQKVYASFQMCISFNISHTLFEPLYTFYTFLMCIRIFYFLLHTVLIIITNLIYILLFIHLDTYFLYT